MRIERQEISGEKIRQIKDAIQVNRQIVTPSAMPFLIDRSQT